MQYKNIKHAKEKSSGVRLCLLCLMEWENDRKICDCKPRKSISYLEEIGIPERWITVKKLARALGYYG